MSYNKAMKFSKKLSKKSVNQPILGMPFKDGERVESYSSVAERTATGFNVRVTNNYHEDFIQISEEFKTEEDAINYIRDNDIDNQYKHSRVYSTEGMRICGW